MPSYYQKVFGNLNVGDIAKSSDIHHIQRHIQDAFKNANSDFHDRESYILGSNEVYKNSFNLTIAPKRLGRYIDSSNVFNDETDYLNINYYDIKQPILKTKSSLYSIVTKMRNTSNRDIPITCEIQDDFGNVLRSNTVTLMKNTKSANYEIVFDLDFYPTPPNLSFEDLQKRDGRDIPPRTREESYDEGYDESHNKEIRNYFSAGVSKLFFVIKRANLNEVDLETSNEEEVIFDPGDSIGVYCQKGSPFPNKEIFVEKNGGTTFVLDDEGRNIYYQDIYANETTYLCSGGQAIIDGEKVQCVDTHISVEGGNSLGNVLTQVYLDSNGHLRSSNKQASLTTNIYDFVEDISDPLPMAYLPIALILTYSNAKYGISKEPLIIQDGYGQKPRSHHERLRRLEKQMDWSNDIALPGRIKWTLNDTDWIDESGESLIDLPHTTEDSKDIEALSDDNIFITTDENGNVIVKLSDAVTQTIPITLKEELKTSDGKEITLEETDVLNVSSFSKIEHMVHDSEKGTLTLDKEKKETKTSKDSKEGESSEKKEEDKKSDSTMTINPWGIPSNEEIAKSKFEVNEREFEVTSGKNGSDDWDSSYPGMTLYTESNIKLTKLTIPIRKFKNCSSVKFYIWRRQDTNNKENDVWFQKRMYTSKDFSLVQAKEKDGYQYVDEGFTIEFGEGGLSLDTGQYVVVAVPTPKSDKGSLFLETYKPENGKNFCIRYRGAANASHFLLFDRYQETWYNSASAVVEEEDYYTEGTVISKTLTWTEKGLERIQSVKPIIGKHLTLGNKTKDSYELYVSTGGDWIKMTPDEENTINNGGARTFKWKMVFKSDGKTTPKLAYDETDKYALKFILTREKPASFLDLDSSIDYNKNMCITSVPFSGDDILREYLGDMNFGLTHSRFQGYEFARIWAEKLMNKKLLIDIQASDRSTNYNIKNNSGKVDLWSLHYCDLTLDDFSQIDVDYNDYATELEYDENNMRLKLDSAHSYNDDDIQILALKDFTKTPNDIDETEDKTLKFKAKETVTDNQVFLKRTFENPLDLTKYTGLKFKFNIDNKDSPSMILRGLGIYISSTEQSEVPSNIKNQPNDLQTLRDTSVLPKEIDPDTSSYSYYEGKTIELIHEIDTTKDGNKIYGKGYYKYVKQFNENKGKYIWKLQQIHDIKTYNIYEIGDIRCINDNEFEVRIEIEQDSNNLKHVKEIGIITLNDEEKYDVEKELIGTELTATCEETGVIKIQLEDETGALLNGKPIWYNNSKKDTVAGIRAFSNITGEGTATFYFKGDDTYAESNIVVDYDFTEDGTTITTKSKTIVSAAEAKLELSSVRGISEECIKIYDPEDKSVDLTVGVEGAVSIYRSDNITLTDNNTEEGKPGTYVKNLGTDSTVKNIKQLTPSATQICIRQKDNGVRGPRVLCYINNPFEGGLSRYKHIGIQLASDVYIPKDCLKVNICSDINGEEIIDSVNLPTMNSIYYPNTAESQINLSQIFKKLDIGDEQIKSISISTTPYFYEFINNIVSEEKPAINLFLGKITLYRAETIPIYHNKMRFKFYSTTNGEIDHHGKQVSTDTISIRKIGAVLDYD